MTDMKSLKKMDWNGLMTIPQRESSYDTLGTWALAPLRHAKRRRHPGRLLLFLMVKPCQTYSSGHIFYQSWVILSLIFAQRLLWQKPTAATLSSEAGYILLTILLTHKRLSSNPGSSEALPKEPRFLKPEHWTGCQLGTGLATGK